MSEQIRFTAFILAHGIISPIRLTQHTPSTDRNSLHYTIHGEPLPQYRRLYSPKILGNAYYDRQGTDVFILSVFDEYYKDGTKLDLDSFCLQKIAEYEKEHTDSMKHSLEDMDKEFAPLFQSGIYPYTGQVKSIRKQYIEGITHKTNTEWCEHTYFIQEKRYQINRDNCILLFCNNMNIHTQRRDTEYLFQYGNHTVNVNIHPHPNYYQLTIKMTRTVMYTFEQMNDLMNSIINDIITRSLDSSKQHDSRDWRADRGTKAKEVTGPSRSRTPEPMVAHEIVFYDFTCCTIRFPLETELYGMNVNLLLASISRTPMLPTPMLVYGTTRTEVVDDEKMLRGMLPTTGRGGILRPDDSDVEEIQDDFTSSAGSASPDRSTSVSVETTVYLFVNVDPNLHTFISTVSVDGGGAAVSVSPSGGHRSSNKNRNINKTRNSIRKKNTRRNKRSLRRMKRRTYRRAYQTIKKK